MTDTLQPDGPVAADRGSTSPEAPELLYRSFQERDEPALVVEPFTHRSPEEWRWIFRHGPDGPAEIGIVASGDEVAGCIAHIPSKAWIDGKELRLAIGCNMVITPEYRGRGGARLLVEGFHESNHGFDMNFGTVNEASSHITGRGLGTVTMGQLPEWRRFAVRGQRVGPVVGAIVSAAERLYGLVSSWPNPRLEVVDLDDRGVELDSLARDSASFAPCIRVRDARYVRWHWREWPEQEWRVRGVCDRAGALRGFIAFGVSRDGDGRIGIVADLLAKDYATTRALLADAWRLLRERGCERVLCSYRDPRPWARRAMWRSGFRPFDGLVVACGPLSPAAPEVVTRLDSWYLTHADVIL